MTIDSDREERLQPVLDRIASKGPTRWIVSVGDGWIDLVLELDRTLVQIVPNYQVLQVKEKFGTLRFYTSLPQGLDEQVASTFQDAVEEACEKSAHICEECGKPGKLRTERRWIRTLCEWHNTRDPERTIS